MRLHQEYRALFCAVGVAWAFGASAATAAELGGEAVPVERLLTDTGALSAWLQAHQPEVFAAAARVEQANALVEQSRVIPNPTLSVAVGGLTVGDRNPTSLAYGDTMNVSVGVSELVELGKRGPRARSAELRRSAARASARDVVAEKLSDARDAIARVVYVRERGRVLEERLRSAKNVAALEQVRLEHGDISGIDHDRLELDAAAAAREVAESQADLESAMADCSTLLLAPCAPGESTMAIVDAAAPLPPAFGDVGERIHTRPDVQAALLGGEAARSDATLYRRQALPDPTFGLTYTKDYLVAAGNQANTLTASVSIPLPLFDHGQHLSRFAEGQARELDFQARALETRALSEARALLARREVLMGKLDALSRFAIPRADAVLKSSDDAYHHGQLSLTDLLIVRREHASLLLDAIDTRYELFTVRNTLHRTLGIGVPTTPPPLPASRTR
ncbi:MAG TPA: TolC family protein [Polyangiaceae bacterium]|nr:TolC family protein [Polyangiaceae bacterium]